MAATAGQIARLRRMIAEPTDDTYDDDALAECVERYPLLDERGEAPYTWDTTTQPPTQKSNDDWIPTYDLEAAAADLWEEKAATYATQYDFEADGASHSLSQRYDQMMARARYHRSRRSPCTGTLVQWPKETGREFSWIVNRLKRLE